MDEVLEEALTEDTEDVAPADDGEGAGEEAPAADGDEVPVDEQGAEDVTPDAGQEAEPEATEETVADEELESQEEDAPGVSVTAHVQNIGWVDPVGSGEVAGTSGRSLRVEALRISPVGELPEGSIQYQVHVQNIGWQGWVSDGDVAGTSDKSYRIEALKVRLTGELAEQYDVYYQLHVQNVGWMGLAKNGEASGTSGKSLRVEAVRVWLVEKGAAAPETTSNTSAAFQGILGLKVTAHEQNRGWMAAVGSGATAGVTGQSLRLEALKMEVSGLDQAGGITYRAHVQNVGWQGWKADGQVAGTTGKGYRIEAFEVELTDELAETYDIYYRAHVSNVGWLGWAKNGQTAGSTGMSQRVEAIQVRLVEKGASAPDGSDSAYHAALIQPVTLTFAAYVQNASDWQGSVSSGKTAGTTGKSLWIEGFRAAVAGDEGSIQYRGRFAGGSWTEWQADGSDLHVSGQRLETLQVRLSGVVSQTYDVWYRAHMQNEGWTGWAKNGASVGSEGLGYRIESVQVSLVPKGGAAPGSTYRPLVNKDNLYDAMTKKAQGYSSSTGYLLMVDTTNCRVGVYKGSRNNWKRIYYWRCSCGSPTSRTVRGVFRSAQSSIHFGEEHGYTCWYATQIYGDYLFHSVKYKPLSKTSFVDSRLGYHISAGCVRLAIENAQWIYYNIPYGTTIVSY